MRETDEINEQAMVWTRHRRREAAVQYLILKEVKVNSSVVQVGKYRQRKQYIQTMEMCRSMEHSCTYQ